MFRCDGVEPRDLPPDITVSWVWGGPKYVDTLVGECTSWHEKKCVKLFEREILYQNPWLWKKIKKCMISACQNCKTRTKPQNKRAGCPRTFGLVSILSNVQYSVFLKSNQPVGLDEIRFLEHFPVKVFSVHVLSNPADSSLFLTLTGTKWLLACSLLPLWSLSTSFFMLLGFFGKNKQVQSWIQRRRLRHLALGISCPDQKSRPHRVCLQHYAC